MYMLENTTLDKNKMFFFFKERIPQSSNVFGVGRDLGAVIFFERQIRLNNELRLKNYQLGEFLYFQTSKCLILNTYRLCYLKV